MRRGREGEQYRRDRGAPPPRVQEEPDWATGGWDLGGGAACHRREERWCVGQMLNWKSVGELGVKKGKRGGEEAGEEGGSDGYIPPYETVVDVDDNRGIGGLSWLQRLRICDKYRSRSRCRCSSCCCGGRGIASPSGYDGVEQPGGMRWDSTGCGGYAAGDDGQLHSLWQPGRGHCCDGGGGEMERELSEGGRGAEGRRRSVDADLFVGGRGVDWLGRPDGIQIVSAVHFHLRDAEA